MSQVQPNFQNKTSFDNYIYYRMIHKKIKYEKGILILFEVLFMFYSFIFYWIGFSRLFMPALYLITIKNIYFIISSGKRKGLISLAIDTFSITIMIAQTFFWEQGINILEALTENILFYPIIFIHIRVIKNEYIEEKLSSMKDYPYFSLDIYKPDELDENNEFNNDTGDRLLKTAMLDARTENRSKKIRIAKLCTCAAIVVCLSVFLNSQSTIYKLKNTETFLPDKTYTKQIYINVDVIPATIEHAVVGEGRNFWIRVNDTEQYIYIRCSNAEYKTLSGNKPINIKGKINFASEGELENRSLCKPVLNTIYTDLDNEQKAFLDSITNRDLYIKMMDEDIVHNKSFYSIIITLILASIYILLIILPRKHMMQ